MTTEQQTSTTVSLTTTTRTRAVRRPTFFRPYYNNQRFIFSCTFLSVLCFIQRLFSVRNLLSAHVSNFCKDPLKIHIDFHRQPFLLLLLQTRVDSRLICASTAVTLMLHVCGGSFRPTYAHNVTAFPAFDRTLLAPVIGPFFAVLDRSFAVNGTDAPTLLGVSAGIFPLDYSTFCRWTHHCAFFSPHQLQLPFNMAFLHSWPVRKVR